MGPRNLPDSVRPTSVRFDEATYGALVEACNHRGLSSVSEYIRQAVIDRIAWDRALMAMEAGADPEFLSDRARLLAALAEIALRPPAPERSAGEQRTPPAG